jgi:hypothetical protein
LDSCIASLHSSPIPGRSRAGCVPGMEERVVVAHSIPLVYLYNRYKYIQEGTPSTTGMEVRVEKKV